MLEDPPLSAKTKLIFITFLLMGIPFYSSASAMENAKLIFQTGMGSLDYEESTDAFGSSIESESSSRVFLLEVLGELPVSSVLFAGGLVTAGWTSSGDEIWWENGSLRQTNDLQIDLYNLELRLGYRFPVRENSGFSASVYVNTGYDVFSFERSNFVVLGVPQSIPTVTEEFDLLRLGAGIQAAMDVQRWSFFGEAGYGRYLDGQVNNSAFPGITLETEGNRWHVEIGVDRRLSTALSLGLALSSSMVDLQESEPVSGVVFPNSRTGINSLNLRLTKVF